MQESARKSSCYSSPFSLRCWIIFSCLVISFRYVALLPGLNHLACCTVVDAKTRGPKSREPQPFTACRARAALHHWLKVSETLKVSTTLNPLILQKTARKPRLLGPCKGLPKLGLTIFSRTKAVLTSCVFVCPN